MGQASSKDAAASQQKLKPTVSIGTPNPESVQRWQRESVKPENASGSASTANGAANPSTVKPEPSASKGPATITPAADASLKPIPEAAPSHAETQPTEKTSDKANSRGEADAGDGKPDLRENPVFEDGKPASAIGTEGHPDAIPMTGEVQPSKAKEIASPAPKASNASVSQGSAESAPIKSSVPEKIEPETTGIRPPSTPEKAPSAAAMEKADVEPTTKPVSGTTSETSVVTADKSGGAAKAAGEADKAAAVTTDASAKAVPKPHTSEIQPEADLVSKPKAAVSEIKPDNSAGPSKPAASSAGTSASGARPPEVPAVGVIPAASKPAAPKLPARSAAAKPSAKKASDDKVGGGGCFGCFSTDDKKKIGPPVHDPTRPSIGTPTGFVPPGERRTAQPVSLDPHVKDPNFKPEPSAASKPAKVPVQPEVGEDVASKKETAAPSEIELPSPRKEASVTSPQTPEKSTTLPTSRNARNISEPASPEEFPKVPQVSHHVEEEFPKVPDVSHPSGVMVEYSPERSADLSAMTEPVVYPPRLREVERPVIAAPGSFHQPRAERLTVTGEEDVSSPAAVAALAAGSHTSDSHLAAISEVSGITDAAADKQADSKPLPTTSGAASSEVVPSRNEATGIREVAPSESRIPKLSQAENKAGNLAAETSNPAESVKSSEASKTGTVTSDTSRSIRKPTETVIPESVVAAPLPPLTKPGETASAPASKIPSFAPQKDSQEVVFEAPTQPKTAAVEASGTVSRAEESKEKPARPVKQHVVDQAPKNPLFFDPSGTASNDGQKSERKEETPLAVVAPEVADIASERQAALHPGESYEKTAVSAESSSGTEKAIPLAAVAPAVAEIAHEREAELHPGESFEKTAVASEPHRSPHQAGGEEVPKAVVTPEAKQTVAAALREDFPTSSELAGHSVSQDRQLQDAVQKQNVAQALQEEHRASSLQRPIAKANSGDSINTADTEARSMLVEPGTPGSMADRSASGRDEEPAIKSSSLKSGKSRVAFRDNPVYQAGDERDATLLAAPHKTEEPSMTDEIREANPSPEVDSSRSVTEPVTPSDTASGTAPESSSNLLDAGIRNATRSQLDTGGSSIPEPTSSPVLAALPPTKSSKTFALEPQNLTPKEQEKARVAEEKQAALLKKQMDREAKARDKLRQKSLKKKSSKGFFGVFGGSSKQMQSGPSSSALSSPVAAAPTVTQATPAAASATSAAAPLAAETAPLATQAAPQAATVSAQSGANVAVPVVAGVGAGVGAGVIAGSAAATSSRQRTVPDEPKYLEPITSGPSKPVTPPASPLHEVQSTPAEASPVVRAPEIREDIPSREIQPEVVAVPVVEPVVETRRPVIEPPTPAYETPVVVQEPRAPSVAVPAVIAEESETAVTPAEVAAPEDKKAKKAREKEISRTDYSAIHMAKTPSVTIRRDFNPATGVYDGEKGLHQPGDYTPLRSASTVVQGTIALNSQASFKRKASSNQNAAPSNGPQAALQSLSSYEFKGPKAQYGKGIMSVEAPYDRNYRPMSTHAGIPAPASSQKKTMPQRTSAPRRKYSSWEVPPSV